VSTDDHPTGALPVSGRLDAAQAAAFVDLIGRAMIDGAVDASLDLMGIVDYATPCRYRPSSNAPACGRASLVGCHRCPDHARPREITAYRRTHAPYRPTD
jgi:hypothetical protein